MSGVDTGFCHWSESMRGVSDCMMTHDGETSAVISVTDSTTITGDSVVGTPLTENHISGTDSTCGDELSETTIGESGTVAIGFSILTTGPAGIFASALTSAIYPRSPPISNDTSDEELGELTLASVIDSATPP